MNLGNALVRLESIELVALSCMTDDCTTIYGFMPRGDWSDGKFYPDVKVKLDVDWGTVEFIHTIPDTDESETVEHAPVQIITILVSRQVRGDKFVQGLKAYGIDGVTKATQLYLGGWVFSINGEELMASEFLRWLHRTGADR